MSCDPSHELWFSFFYVSNPKHFDEDLLLRLASFSSIFMYFVTCKTFLFLLLFVLFLVILYAVFKVQVQTVPVSPLFLNESLEKSRVVGLSGLEPPTSRLSGVRSNQLSYKPTTGNFRSGPED